MILLFQACDFPAGLQRMDVSLGDARFGDSDVYDPTKFFQRLRIVVRGV